MQIIERDVGGVGVIELKRAFVVNDDPALAEAVRTRVAPAGQRGQREVMLDFGRVSTVDSMGVGEVVRAHHQMCWHGGRITLLQPSGRLTDLACQGMVAHHGRGHGPTMAGDILRA